MNRAHAKALALKALPVLTVAIVLLLADIQLNKPDTRAAVSDMLPALPAGANNHEQQLSATVLSLFAGFDAPPIAEPVQPTSLASTRQGLDLSQQALQQGLLHQLYIEDERYRLTAVISQQHLYASLTIEHVNAPEHPAGRLIVKKGDTIGPYQVVSVSTRRLTLRQQERELWLQLFTPVSVEIAAD